MSPIPPPLPADLVDDAIPETDPVPQGDGQDDPGSMPLNGPAIVVNPVALTVIEGGVGSYQVSLASQPTGPVSVSVEVPSPELTVTPARLEFTREDWQSAQAVAVTASHDDDALADAPLRLLHRASGGGYGEAIEQAVIVTVTEDDVPTILMAVTDGAEPAVPVRFAVSLSAATAEVVTVKYATGADGDTATEGDDYVGTDGTLTFPAGSTRALTIEVEVQDDAVDDPAEQFTMTLSNAVNAALAGGGATLSAMGSIEDDDPTNDGASSSLALASLHVAGGNGAMYPVFTPDTLHYARKCNAGTTLQVSAQAQSSDASLTLLRKDESGNVAAVGTLNTSLTVDENDDIAIMVGADSGASSTYVVHCLPSAFSNITVLEKKAGASDGLLFLVSGTYYAIVDYNGVPRFHAQYHNTRGVSRNFRPHPSGPMIDGKSVNYSILSFDGATLLDKDLGAIRIVNPVAPLKTDNHDFVLGSNSYLFISYVKATRDYSVWDDSLQSSVKVRDSVITEVSFSGRETFRWNSWDHLKIVPDCKVLRSEGEYAHLNSLQVVDGDIIASFRGCAQVVRIDGETGALKWKLGGTEPPVNSETTFLEIVGDPLGEFCGQHHATLTTSGSGDQIVLFDNGTHCLGPRKDLPVVTRVVQYDISSGTQASFVKEYRRPEGHGYSPHGGGVTVLENGNWLISWQATQQATKPVREVAGVTEVDTPGAQASAVFHMNMSKSGRHRNSYRVYHAHHADAPIPLNLP